MSFLLGRQHNVIIKCICIVALFIMNGCTALMITPLVDPLTQSLQQQTDLELVCDGTPALLLMIDGFIASDPHNSKLLMTGTQAYTAYAAALTECGESDRAAQLSARAKEYGIALLNGLPGFQDSFEKPLAEFTQSLKKYDAGNVDALFWGATGWGTWIRYQEGAPAAVADLPKVEQIMLRVLEMDENFYYGGAHFFLGAYYAARPEIYGGKPEESRLHFERALSISDRQFLLIQVTYAETYARMSFDRELYEGLLQEVLDFPLESRPELNLSNSVAKRRARRQLDKADIYF